MDEFKNFRNTSFFNWYFINLSKLIVKIIRCILSCTYLHSIITSVFLISDITSDTQTVTDILMADNIVIGNSRPSVNSSNQISEIKTENEIDLMEIDAITDHI